MPFVRWSGPVCLAAVVLVATFGLPASAAGDGLSAKRAQAATLEARIQAQGERLSIADESYNQARIHRQSLDAGLSTARSEETAAEQHWRMLRARLGGRVRALYMHPGAPFEVWLGTTSLDEDSRARVLSASVLSADTKLVAGTEQARGQVRQRAAALETLTASAQRAESDLQSKRVAVAGELRAQRALLAGVNGQIAMLISQERQRKLAEAARAAAQQAAAAKAASPTAKPTTATPPPIGSVLPTPDPVSGPPPPPPSAKAGKAVETARAQVGKPYEWSAAGPNSFDCSGLTMYAWSAAGVSLPHSAAAQFDMLPKVARAQLQPGDLVFYGSPIHHVGIYEGGGVMINAPQTGENVRRDSIDRADYAGAARPV